MVDEIAAHLHWINSVPLGAVIATFGLLGNIISIIVWRRLLHTKLKDNQSFGIYLITLALCDSGLLVFFLLSDTIKANNPEIVHNYAYASFFSWFAFPFFFIFVVASIWMVVGVTINRFVMIQYPTKVRTIYSKPRTYISISMFLAFAVIVNVPHFFNYHVPLTNGTWSIQFTDYGNTDGSKNYEFWVHCIVLVLAPWFTIVTLNTLIVRKLSEQMKKFENMKDNSKDGSVKAKKKDRREREMTITLLTVTFTFLLFLLWQCITQCFWMLDFGKDKDPMSRTWHYVDSSFAFAKLGVILNASINWFLYCVSGTTFRKEMIRMFRGIVSEQLSFTSLTSMKSKSTLTSFDKTSTVKTNRHSIVTSEAV